MKIALVHDWFNEIGGSEKVVREILNCYPEADVFSLMDFFSDDQRATFLLNKHAHTTFLQHIPFSKYWYRLFFPLFPLAIKQLNLSKYDLILSSSSSVAKNIIKAPHQLHICYCHSPARYVWDLRADYLAVVKNPISKTIFNFFLNRFQTFDLLGNKGVDYFIANSNNVKTRIQKHYHREATVIYPPVDIDKFTYHRTKQSYYFTVSRLVAYKKVEQIIRAFAHLPQLTLIVAGDGPNKKHLQSIATANVKVVGFLPAKELETHIQQAKAFIVNANEDFGITVVEAQSCGTPIIAPYLGGYIETIQQNTGLFFQNQSVLDIEEAVITFEKKQTVYHEIDFANNVFKFRKNRFKEEYVNFVNACCNQKFSSGIKA